MREHRYLRLAGRRPGDGDMEPGIAQRTSILRFHQRDPDLCRWRAKYRLRWASHYRDRQHRQWSGRQWCGAIYRPGQIHFLDRYTRIMVWLHRRIKRFSSGSNFGIFLFGPTGCCDRALPVRKRPTVYVIRLTAVIKALTGTILTPRSL